jgi:soluble lytic murein transglycosylase-like protein
MEIRKILLTSLVVITCLIFLCGLQELPIDKKTKENDLFATKNYVANKSNSMKMYDYLEKYSKEYEIPKYIFYNIAFLETRYKGPFDWDYVPSKVSPVGAQGPMQVMPSTAKLIHKKSIPIDILRNDIEFNVRTSAILLNKLFKQYKSWSLVCGCYNTGKPIINGYAKFCVSNLDYQKNWDYIN